MMNPNGRAVKTTATSPQRPLLKWPGGKRRLLPDLAPLVPERHGRYYEPFLGGGALFFSLKPRLATLSDTNPDLIACYQEIRRNPDKIISQLRQLNNSEESYYKIRDEEPSDPTKRATQFLYLITLAFNGIYRQNLHGKFNVPYGQKSHINLAESLPVLDTARALRRARLRCADFEEAVSDALPGDVVYFDPPYTVAHGNNGFVKYNAKIFSWKDQERLAKLSETLADKGCTVIVSNADHPSIMSLYTSFQVLKIERQSVIAASRSFRKLTTECVFVRKGDKCF